MWKPDRSYGARGRADPVLPTERERGSDGGTRTGRAGDRPLVASTRSRIDRTPSPAAGTSVSGTGVVRPCWPRMCRRSRPANLACGKSVRWRPAHHRMFTPRRNIHARFHSVSSLRG